MKPRYEKVSLPPQQSFLYFQKRARSFPFKWHVHAECELTLVTSGSGARFVGDHIGHYGGTDLVLIGPGLPHTWHAEPDPHRHRAVVIQFRADFLGTAEAVPELHGVNELIQRAARGLSVHGRARKDIGERMVAMRSMSHLQRLAELLILLDRLSKSRECRHLSSPAYVSSFCREDETRLSRVCEYISLHHDRQLTLPEVAGAAHMSEASFSRYFKRAVGKPFSAYLNELRVGRACRLLVETDLGIAEICHRSGFGGLSNFNRRFRQLKAQTPKQYRERYRNA